MRTLDKLIYFFEAPIVRFYYTVVTLSSLRSDAMLNFLADLLHSLSRSIQLRCAGGILSLECSLGVEHFQSGTAASLVHLEFDYRCSRSSERTVLSSGLTRVSLVLSSRFARVLL